MPLLRCVNEIIPRTYLSKNPHFFRGFNSTYKSNYAIMISNYVMVVSNYAMIVV